ncbi:MAG: ATP-binding protein [Alphaproteobacteria bacterium]
MLCDLKKLFKNQNNLKNSLGLLALGLGVAGLAISLSLHLPEYYIFILVIASLGVIFSFLVLLNVLNIIYENEQNSLIYYAILEEEKRPIAVIFPDKKFFANRSGYEFFGENDMLENMFNRIVSEDEDNSFLAFKKIKNAIDNMAPQETKICLYSSAKDDDSKFLEWYSVSLDVLKTDFNNKFVVLKVDDITAQKTINEIVKQELDEKYDLIDFLPVGVFISNSDGKIIYANYKLADWLAFDRKELQGEIIYKFIKGDHKPEVDGLWEGEVEFQNASGVQFLSYLSQSTYDAGDETRVRGIVVKDIMRSKDWDRALNMAEKKFRWLLEETPVGIVIADIDANIIDCNKAFSKIINKSREDILGQPVLNLIAAADKENLDANLSKIVLGATSGFHVETRLETDAKTNFGEKTAEIFAGPMRSYSSLKNGDNDVDGLIFHFIDTTDRKNLKMQFEQAQKMQAMGQLAGGVAHDFNNLLTAIMGYADFLLQRHSAGDPSHNDIKQIQNDSRRAAALVKKLLAFSKQQALAPVMVDLTEAISDYIHYLNRMIGETVELKIFHARDLGLVRVDPTQLDQVITNLVLNAKDAMPGGGTITLKTSRIMTSEPIKKSSVVVPSGDYIALSVSDTGCGISPENVEKIFEPFFSTKGKSGTGLGLATVYGIVQQTKGFITVESVLGEGSTFTIYFKAYDKKTDEDSLANKTSGQNKASKSKEDDAQETDENQLTLDLNRRNKKEEPVQKLIDTNLAGSGRILLVEDETAVRAFGARALKNKGYEVTECASGEEAMEVLENDSAIDLLITDMVMPGMGGATLAHFVREQFPQIKVILVSGYSEDVARDELASSKEFYFLAKPFSLVDLAAMVKKVLAE